MSLLELIINKEVMYFGMLFGVHQVGRVRESEGSKIRFMCISEKGSQLLVIKSTN